jgi:tetraacyldisaccharide-1-P 4'-kinase
MRQRRGRRAQLLARHAATVVATDRIAGARLAAPLGSVIVMDDGLQNPSLAKDFTLAVVDGETGVGNGYWRSGGTAARAHRGAARPRRRRARRRRRRTRPARRGSGQGA